MNKELLETIEEAIRIKELHKLSFVTIWKTSKSFGFNFDNKPVGYTMKDYGIKRTVIGVY